MSLGFETPEEAFKLFSRHLVSVYKLEEKMFFEGKISLENYLKNLKEATATVPVHEFYQRLEEQGKISENQLIELFNERSIYLENELKAKKDKPRKDKLR